MAKNHSRRAMRQEMELQLHEQYAQNNNANLGSIITLIVTLLAVFYGYGYVYLNSSLTFSDDFGQFLDKNDNYTLDALLFTAMAVYVVLGIIYYICYGQGLRQRMEQFVTFAIRTKYYRKLQRAEKPRQASQDFPESLMDDSYGDIFPSGYHPFKKCGTMCCSQCILSKTQPKTSSVCKKDSELAQGLFGDLLPVIKSLAVLLALSIAVKLGACAVYKNLSWSFEFWNGIVSGIILLSVCVLEYGTLSGYSRKLQGKYSHRVSYYTDRLTQE